MVSVTDILSTQRVTLIPGVADCLMAKAAENAGADAVIISGFAASGTYLGKPDFGFINPTDLINITRHICRAVSIPVIVDGDTGYGGALNVMELVDQVIRLGARGIILEDQVWPKRCGHMRGKSVISQDEHAAKIAAAAAVKQKFNQDFIIIARTDARSTHGLDEAIQRVNAYAHAGADMVFVEAPISEEEIAAIGNRVSHPLLLNLIEGGLTPILPMAKIAQYGFSAVAYPLTGIFAVTKILQQVFARLLSEGISQEADPDIVNFSEYNRMIGLENHYLQLEKFAKQVDGFKSDL